MKHLAFACRLLCVLTLWICARAAVAQPCPESDAGLELAPGFCATIFADSIGHARHIAVAPNGVVYVNTWSGRYYGNDVPHPGGFVVALQDTTGNGHADLVERFGKSAADGAAGGTGIAIYRAGLYVELNDRILRYPLPSSGLVPTKNATTIVKNLPLDGDHPMHPFAIDADGMLYVDLGSASNACQKKNRELESTGIDPCSELGTRGGIWRYDANKTDQRFSPAARYATGIRNAVGIAVDSNGGAVYATQHGRDQLRENWPKLYTAEQGAKWPAEELLQIERGNDYGWPECYFDPDQRKLVRSPEYGGDGGRAVGPCAAKVAPVAFFPAHWAPNAVLISNDGSRPGSFPDRYRNGAFIAFHGSWNRAPFAQGGYNVVFQSLAPGTPDPCEIFADGFAGPTVSPGGAAHRPSGLALGPDGALYVSDDQHGRIYRITYVGGSDANASPRPCPSASDAPVAATAKQSVAKATQGVVAIGDSVFHGSGGCTACHGDDAKGSPLGPDLTDPEWLWGDGSAEGIAKSIRDGVPTPRQFRSPMPPLGGAQLTDEQVSAVAAYVWSLSHPGSSGAAEQLLIPGERVFPESLTSTRDGSIFIGSVGVHRIFRVAPGSQTAESWVMVDPTRPQRVFGVFADDISNTLWACVNSFDGTSPAPELQAIDIATGKTTVRYPMPTPRAFCNDIAVGLDGSVYATDTNNGEIVRLRKGESSLEVWAGEGAFGKRDAVLDGISVLGDRLYVNTLKSGKLFRISIGPDGKAGAATELTLSRPIDAPDGMRSLGATNVLLVESGGKGRLSRVEFDGNKATVTTLQEGFPDGPTAVTQVGQNAYVLEAQLAAMDPKSPKVTNPFRATAVQIR